MKLGDIVEVIKDSECPIVGFKKGTVGFIVSEIVNNKCFVATSKHKFGGYYGWYVETKDLKLIKEKEIG